MDNREARATTLSPETLRSMGSAVGLAIDDARLPAVQTVLGELVALAAALERLDLDGVEPDSSDPRAGWEDLP